MEKHKAKKYANYCVERYIKQPVITIALFIVKFKNYDF